MPLKLDTPVASKQVDDIEVTSFAIDLKTNALFISIDLLDSTGEPVSKENIVLVGQETQDAILRANAIAGSNVYAALKQSLYEAVIAKKGLSGTIS